jgi:hypothetical protein
MRLSAWLHFPHQTAYKFDVNAVVGPLIVPGITVTAKMPHPFAFFGNGSVGDIFSYEN